LCEQERISLELYGPPHTTNDDQMVAASMLGLRSTFKNDRNTVQDWRAIFTFGPRETVENLSTPDLPKWRTSVRLIVEQLQLVS
jgi:hypothetical protein